VVSTFRDVLAATAAVVQVMALTPQKLEENDAYFIF
jgi:hypothetical protein